MQPSTKQLCTFYLDDLFVGIDVRVVQEVVRYQAMTSVPLAPRAVSGLINLRGQIVTAIDLRRRLEMPDRPADRLPMNVVVCGDEGAVSLLVDQIGDVQEVNADDYEPLPETLQEPARSLTSGVYKLPEGLLLELDAERAVQLAPADD